MPATDGKPEDMFIIPLRQCTECKGWLPGSLVSGAHLYPPPNPVGKACFTSKREPRKLEVGKTYRLARDVVNPEADRRATRDWRKAPIFKAGLIFFVEPGYCTGTEKEQAPRLLLVGHRYTSDNFFLFQAPALAIAEMLEEIVETPEATMTRVGCAGSLASFATWMLETGRWDVPTFETLFKTWEIT